MTRHSATCYSAAEDTGLAAAAACGGMSFTPGRCYSPQTRREGTRHQHEGRQDPAEPVTAVLVHHDTDRYDLTIKTGHRTAVIHTTSSHLFWDHAARQWTSAAALTGNYLRTPSGGTAIVLRGKATRARSGWMWDLTVRSDHDFYVDAAAGPILAHNCLEQWGVGPKTYQTYTKVNPETGQVYAGRTSGYGTPLENIAARDSGHAYNDLGFGPAQLDQSSENYVAVGNSS